MLQQPPESYRGYRTAGIRLREEPLPALDYHRTEHFNFTLDAVHAFDKAHVVMLIEGGFLDRSVGRTILQAVRRMEHIGVQRAREQAQGGEHSLEYYVTREHGEAVGGWINLARSSGDLGEVSRRISMRNYVVATLAALADFRGLTIELSERHQDVVYPAQTFLQHAQPTSLGHWFGMWAEVFARHTERLFQLYARLNESPAGAGILTGSDFPVDRDRTSALLGFDRPLRNTHDAIMSHDVSLETQSILAMIWNDLARLSDDLEHWLATDTRFISVPDRFCDTSSVMPQKRNPMLPQHIKRQAAKALGMLSSGYLSERGASGQAMLERFEPETQMWELFDVLPQIAGALSELLAALEPQHDRMLEAAITGWSTASDLASLIVRQSDLSWRTAHQIVGITVRLAEDRGIQVRDVTAELVDEAAVAYLDRRVDLTQVQVDDALNPTQSVSRRSVYGATAPSAQEAIRPVQGDILQADLAKIATMQQTLTAASASLESAIDQILRENRGASSEGD